MTAPQFDTLRAAKTLKQGGFNETEAETLVNTLDQAVNENLGTKADLKLLQAEVKQGFTKANAATEKAITKSEAATDKLRSDTEKGFTKSEAATDKLRSDIEKAIIQTDAANDKRFATLYRYLLGVGVSIAVMMITLFLVN